MEAIKPRSNWTPLAKNALQECFEKKLLLVNEELDITLEDDGSPSVALLKSFPYDSLKAKALEILKIPSQQPTKKQRKSHHFMLLQINCLTFHIFVNQV